MALVSPGVEVTIIDQSQYLPAAPASVPLILFATAQNKANAAGTGIAVGTTEANANKLYRVTSQRDLVQLFGNPFFYKTTNGTPLQGYELNEYGLLAAYSVLGTTNLIYALRADIDLASLVGRTSRPSGTPTNGTYWLDTSKSTWGIFEFNLSTGKFTNKVPLVVNDSADLVGTTGQPQASIGNIGDYAITFVTDANNAVIAAQPNTYDNYWYKDKTNTWVALGSPDWRNNWPAIISNNAPAGLTAGNTFDINNVTVQVPPSPNNNIAGLAGAINNSYIPGISAALVSGRLYIYSSLEQEIVIDNATGTVLTDLGITADTYYSTTLFYGTNAQQPLWRTTDAQPHPTGSVWIKTNSANLGSQLVMSQYNASTALYTSKLCPLYASDWAAIYALDTTGGKNIPADSLYAQYGFNGETLAAPLSVFKRASTGPAVFLGLEVNPTFDGNASFEVWVSDPGSPTLDGPYTVTMPAPGTGSGTGGAIINVDFVTAWSAANIPLTTAEVSLTGAIALTHTMGGVIILDDAGVTSPASAVTDAGFEVGLNYLDGTPYAKWGPYKTLTDTNVGCTGPGNDDAKFTLETTGYIPTFTCTFGGSGYNVGDIITVGGVFQVKVLSETGGSIDGGPTSVEWISGFATPEYMVQLSNWIPVSLVPNPISPTLYPANNTNWYYSVVNQVDIMTNVSGEWKGYRNVPYASNGLPKVTGVNTTDPNGPIIAASAPETQSDGVTPLSYGDLWIDSNDLENYPMIYRWQSVENVDQWVLIDNTDQLTENGILFADARWGSNDTIDPVFDPIPSITSLLTSDYIDLDCPSAQSYPQGTLLFNTRRSGYNVKQFRTNYFNAADFPDYTLPQEASTWVTVSGNMTNGAPYMGRKAQRIMVVQALKAAINTNTSIREEDTFFNLMATPCYPELQPDMVVLNNDRNETAYIIGDTPLRLADDANDIVAWATNAANATSTGDMGLVTRNTYMGLYYPSGITTDLTGSEVVIPASHMLLRTMIYNDTVAYPWFAPAGQRRGIVDNATNIGYIDGASGEFVVTKNRVQLRDVEYTNFINPIAYFTNIGILNYGNKNSFDSQSALDRTNVARLICYLRWNLQIAVRPFIFEPNDSITRAQVKGVVQTLLADIQSKRGLYDYLVVCDESNNTPARIDRNELWIDVAIEPVKAAEFIYIPVRVLNTGEIAGLAYNG